MTRTGSALGRGPDRQRIGNLPCSGSRHTRRSARRLGGSLHQPRRDTAGAPPPQTEKRQCAPGQARSLPIASFPGRTAEGGRGGRQTMDAPCRLFISRQLDRPRQFGKDGQRPFTKAMKPAVALRLHLLLLLAAFGCGAGRPEAASWKPDRSFEVSNVAVPPPPTQIEAGPAHGCGGLIRVTWSASAGAQKYEIWRSTSDDPASATALTTNHTGARVFDDDAAAFDTLYFYWVRAANAAGVSDFSAAVSARQTTKLWDYGPATFRAGVAVGEDGSVYAGLETPSQSDPPRAVHYATKLTPGGVVLWQVQLPGPVSFPPTVGPGGEVCFLAGPPADVLTLLGPDGTVRWQRQAPAPTGAPTRARLRGTRRQKPQPRPRGAHARKAARAGGDCGRRHDLLLERRHPRGGVARWRGVVSIRLRLGGSGHEPGYR